MGSLKKNKNSWSKKSVLQNIYQSDFKSSQSITKWYESDLFFDLVKKISPDLRLIYISGGEPFLIKRQHVFIDHLLKKGACKNIKVNLNTNLTYLDESLLKKLSSFKQVHFSVSVDAYGGRNDWIRSPSQFFEIEKNMESILKLSGNTEVSINCTVSVYNILYVSELIAWSRKIAKKLNKNIPIVYFDLLHQPAFQNISVLPHLLKKKAINRLESIKKERKLFPSEIEDINSLIKILQNCLENEKIDELRFHFKEHTKTLDQWRKETFLDIFPEFAGHL